MRLRVTHRTTYRYGRQPNWVIQTLRLTPRSHDGQYVVDWRIELDHDARLQVATDAFGNTVHSFTLDGPLDGLVITAGGVVETEDTHGVVKGQVERFPHEVFLRETPLTVPDHAIRAFADDTTQAPQDRLEILHALTSAIHERMVFDIRPTSVETSAAEAFRLGHGVCQDFAHVFIAAARHLGIPSRYVSGYLYRPDLAGIDQGAGHGWAEALIEGLGWIGFDPTNGISSTESHIRVAIGLDYLGAAPVRGSQLGGGDEELMVAVHVETGRALTRQEQRQAQGSGGM